MKPDCRRRVSACNLPCWLSTAPVSRMRDKTMTRCASTWGNVGYGQEGWKMAIATMGPEIDKSALIIVDMQNDFVHPEGGFAHLARETPDAGIDMPFLM